MLSQKLRALNSQRKTAIVNYKKQLLSKNEYDGICNKIRDERIAVTKEMISKVL